MSFKKRVILFDIDHTLINTKILKRLLIKELSRLTGKSYSELKEKEKHYINSLINIHDFDLRKFLKLVGLENNLYKRLDIYKSSLFSETVPSLRLLSKNFNLGIFSEGNIKFQKIKLTGSSIMKYFNQNYIFIEKRKLLSKVINKLPKNAAIVDDSPSVLKSLSQRNDLKLILISRKKVLKSKSATVIDSLSKIEEVINFK